MGVREIDRSLERRWQMGVKDLMAAEPDSGSHTPGAGKVVRHPAAGPGLDGSGDGGGEHWSGTVHTIGRQSAFGEGGPAALIFEQTGGSHLALDQFAPGRLKGGTTARQSAHRTNWYWKVVRQFVSERFESACAAASCLNWLHRLGFAFKAPKKRLLKANESKREAFVRSTPSCGRRPNGLAARILSHCRRGNFRADAELRGKWVLKGKPALVIEHPNVRGEGADLLFSGVPEETGERGMDGTGGQQQQRHLGCLPDATEGKASRAAAGHLGQCAAHRGEAVREYHKKACPGPETWANRRRRNSHASVLNADGVSWEILPFFEALHWQSVPVQQGRLFREQGRADSCSRKPTDQAAHVAHFTASDRKATNRQSTGSHRLAIKGTKARSQARFQDHPRGA